MSSEREPKPYLYSASAVRERAERVLDLALEGELDHFGVELQRLDEAARRVADVTRRAYPTLEIPYHGRLGHFDVGGHTRAEAYTDPRDLIDLVVVSVLLDAGAGTRWRYRERETGLELSRSEGLAVASLRMFESGLLSGEASVLAGVTSEALAEGFQASDANPLVGLVGRCELLHALAEALERSPEMFGSPARVGNLLDYFEGSSEGGAVAAPRILEALLVGLGSIWPGRGDIFFHPRFGWVPFHKLSQWLTYSLIEPLERSGLEVTHLDGLTGLAEYRNGGLFIDTDVIAPKRDAVLEDEHDPASAVVVEWRALTVALLDRIADPVRSALGMTVETLPLARILEGGTWRAGRELAAELREGAVPPIRVRSTGTLF